MASVKSSGPPCVTAISEKGLMPPSTRSTSHAAAAHPPAKRPKAQPIKSPSSKKATQPEMSRVQKPVHGFRVGYKLGPSQVAGRGVFAVAPIKRGTLIWEYTVGESVLEHDEASLLARLSGIKSQAQVGNLLEHIYVWDGKAIEILDDASIWNHAPKPNTGEHPDGEGAGDGLSSYALRDIAAGEELTDDYAL